MSKKLESLLSETRALEIKFNELLSEIYKELGVNQNPWYQNFEDDETLKGLIYSLGAVRTNFWDINSNLYDLLHRSKP